MGGIWIAMISPQTPDCRVRGLRNAKIPPPTVSAAQILPVRPIHHTRLREACARGIKNRPQACAHGICGLFPISGVPSALPSRRGIERFLLPAP